MLFLPRIDYPAEFSFDEMHYVIAAKLLVPPHHNFNWEHPPLAKHLIGLGIRLAGDHPLGWRLASMVFGGLAVAGMYAWGLAVFRQRGLALWTALVALFNMMLFVAARIAMLDIFLLAFLIWGIAAVCAAWDVRRPPGQVRGLLGFAGAMFGLAAACKWVGWVPLVFLLLLLGTVKTFQLLGSTLYRRPREQRAGTEEWYTADLWERFTARDTLLWLVVVPFACYAATHVPLLWLPGVHGTVRDVLALHADMWVAQRSIVGQHHYASPWYLWGLDWKPMWFYYHGGESFRGILLIGNPVVLLPGLAAALWCAWVWWRERTREAFLCAAWYWLLYLSFAVIPRKIAFFHYYLPAACALALPLAYIFAHYGRGPAFRVAWGRWVFLGVTVAVFALFYPVLVGLPLPGDIIPQ